MLRVGIVQIDIRVGDREANRRNLEAHLERSLTPSEHPTAIVIPEIWDVGYDLERAKTVADPEGRSAAEFLGELARKYDVWFTGGSVLASSGGKFFNRAQVVNPSGELVTQYDKVHLIRLMDEHLHITPGSGLGLFDLGETKAGCVVCYDIRFCELLRTYALKGTEVLFVSAEWPLVRAAHWRALTIARAIENQMYVVHACTVGSLPMVPAVSLNYGAASILTPSDFAFSRDGVLAEGNHNQEMMVIGDLNLETIADSRYNGSVLPLRDSEHTADVASRTEVVTL